MFRYLPSWRIFVVPSSPRWTFVKPCRIPLFKGPELSILPLPCRAHVIGLVFSELPMERFEAEVLTACSYCFQVAQYVFFPTKLSWSYSTINRLIWLPLFFPLDVRMGSIGRAHPVLVDFRVLSLKAHFNEMKILRWLAPNEVLMRKYYRRRLCWELS